MGARLGEVTGEAWAKACALALLDQARQGRRTSLGSCCPGVRAIRLDHSLCIGVFNVRGQKTSKSPLAIVLPHATMGRWRVTHSTRRT